MKRTRTLALSLVSLLVAACGGGGGGSNQTTRLLLAFDRSGTLYDDGTFDGVLSGGGSAAGDLADNRGIRGLVSLSLSPLPAGANVVSAELHLRAFVASGNPFGKFTQLNMDHVDLGAGVDLADYALNPALISVYRVVPVFGSTATNLTLDVASALRADVAAGRLVTTFRFVFGSAPLADGIRDNVFISGEPTDPALQPYVDVTYTP